jgi:hypothetical protein
MPTCAAVICAVAITAVTWLHHQTTRCVRARRSRISHLQPGVHSNIQRLQQVQLPKLRRQMRDIIALQTQS